MQKEFIYSSVFENELEKSASVKRKSILKISELGLTLSDIVLHLSLSNTYGHEIDKIEYFTGGGKHFRYSCNK